MTVTTMWRSPVALDDLADEDLTAFTVVAVDETIGTIDRRSLLPEFDHLVVDAGVWKFGRSLAVPVGMISSVDAERQVITLSCTKEQMKEAPGFARDQDTSDPAYLRQLGAYYASLSNS
ncbi:hypothetical protein ACFVXE_39010 [Streptomyces sp. NPDC058231]|uniref:hypothetical protein n=1 Tax=unclassified Streptomyces TaxID=2593676 RepID=UPI0036EA525B